MHLAFEQILTQIVGFLIMLWVLKRIFWKPILNILDERQRVIATEFDYIQKQKDEIKALDEDYRDKMKAIENDAKIKIQEGVEKGEKIAREIEQETRKKASDILKKTQEEVQHEIVQAKAQLKNDIVNMAIAATEKVIQEKLNPKDHQKLIEDTINKLSLKNES